jgi:hypothetical protein
MVAAGALQRTHLRFAAVKRDVALALTGPPALTEFKDKDFHTKGPLCTDENLYSGITFLDAFCEIFFYLYILHDSTNHDLQAEDQLRMVAK